jgi:hypothetical protein
VKFAPNDNTRNRRPRLGSFVQRDRSLCPNGHDDVGKGERGSCKHFEDLHRRVGVHATCSSESSAAWHREVPAALSFTICMQDARVKPSLLARHPGGQFLRNWSPADHWLSPWTMALDGSMAGDTAPPRRRRQARL